MPRDLKGRKRVEASNDADGCFKRLDTHWFRTVEVAPPPHKMGDWRRHYNEEPRYSAIGYKPPITLLSP